ncbi:hypothetical protein BDV10DRAFT_198330 [Aspergillus recurvatus]
MSVSTITGLFSTIDAANGQPTTLSVLTFSPVNTETAPTTRFLWPSSTVDVYTPYTANAVGVYEAAPEVVRTLSPTPTSQQHTDSESPTGTTTATATSQPTGQASTTTGIPSSTQTAGADSLSQGSGNGTSSGALAGAIVGSIAGTALLTLLLAFLFFRRRRTPPAGGEIENGAGLSTKSGAVVSTAAMPRETSDESFSLAAIIPHPADDEAVRSRILTIIDHASLHADNYYGASSPSARRSQDAIARLAEYDSDSLPAPLATMLGQRGIHRKAIAHALVYKLLQAIRPGGELLPKLLAAQPQVDGVTASTGHALFAWRMVTAHLYNHGANNRDPTHAAARDRAASSLAADFTSAFAPYALATFSESDRVSHLSKLAASTAELGIWLFAQPCTFEFEWNKGQDEFAVVPRVTKTFDEQGKRLPRPQLLIEAVQERYPSTV